jgi:unsaturated rhamnogalacturonyl hydrolase
MRSFWQVLAALAVSFATFADAASITEPIDPRAWFPISAAPQGPPIVVGLHKDSHYTSKTIRVLLVMHEADQASLLKSELWPANQANETKGVVTSVVVLPPRNDAKLTLPPSGEFYGSKTAGDAQYLWRWIGMHAPDLIVEVVRGEQEEFHVPNSAAVSLKPLADLLPNLYGKAFDDEPFTAFNTHSACGTGTIPAMRIVANNRDSIERLLKAVGESKLPPSPARLEIQKRLARSPEEIAAQLLEVYGKKLDSVQYIPALAIVGRLREDRLLHGEQSPISPLVATAVEPYLSGKKTALSPKSGGSEVAGHLLFGELAELTGDKRYVELVKAAADRAFDAAGKPRDAMPSHNEMSDAVFMGCPILAQAGKLTGDEKYFDACLRNLLFMHKLCVRDDGLYRHSPLDEAAWGRGNGFPALGLAWSLSEIPETYKDREKIRAMFEAHLSAMLPHQDRGGAWRQVVDKPESYREFTVTAMTTYAMTRGVRMGWLDRAKFGPAIDKGWFAIRARIGTDGGLVDVCTGTGKQKTLRDYYDRPAILGRDDRGGAMALMVTTEMQQYLKWLAAQKK